METDEKKAALRREAETMQAQVPSDNMAAWYFASWLLFFMDAHESAMASWQKSIDGMRA